MENEFQRIIDLDSSTTFGNSITLTANDDEKKALAERFGLLDLSSLSATIVITVDDIQKCFRVEGTLCAELMQKCIISLKPVPESINAPFSVLLVMETTQKQEQEEEINWEADVEYITDSKVDVGEIVAQYLSLMMDPYPKCADQEQETKESALPKTKNPFSILEKLK
jgi:uncharacterized metal-binding protein YceD (DUF177 family)